ncbi:hypothetical protein ID853_17050 [Xenorhabdus sp. Vera]|uniref:hypothetical protein n=1 Tax=Xenorhabdus koppenhoeferi TaxID=351659 RepID=UPI0019C01097|nr:hypothetical protein [Xenorhabdus sp. Vera]MBD2812540.1 hypothetical protein [Xenorhabdus sp. Vera]
MKPTALVSYCLTSQGKITHQYNGIPSLLPDKKRFLTRGKALPIKGGIRPRWGISYCCGVPSIERIEKWIFHEVMRALQKGQASP